MLRILKDINHGYNTVKDGCYRVLSYVMLYVNAGLNPGFFGWVGLEILTNYES